MRLIVLTTTYPLGSVAEAFFASELTVLARSFPELEIIPLRESHGGPRPVPANVQVHPPISSGKSFFATTALLPSVWLRAAKILLDGLLQGKPSLALLKVAVYWACCERGYRKRLAFLKTEPTPQHIIIYAYWGGPQAAAIPFARKCGTRTAVRYHRFDLYADRPDNLGFLPMRPELRRTSELNLLISSDGLDYFRKQPWPVAGRCELLRLGSDDFGLRPRLDPSSDPLALVSVSTLIPRKRVKRIGALVRELNRTRPTHWTHIGGEQSEIEEMRHRFRDMPTVRFLGPLDREGLRQFYSETDLTAFINLSTDEGISVAAMEAMSAGLPVIATDVGGMSELVVTGKSGLLIDVDAPEDAVSLAAHLMTECGPGGSLARSRPREFWEMQYSAEQNARGVVQLFYDLFNETHATSYATAHYQPHVREG